MSKRLDKMKKAYPGYVCFPCLKISFRTPKMSKRLDIFLLYGKMHKYRLFTIVIIACICAICQFCYFLHIILDIYLTLIKFFLFLFIHRLLGRYLPDSTGHNTALFGPCRPLFHAIPAGGRNRCPPPAAPASRAPSQPFSVP